MSPDIDILIPTYARVKWLEEAVYSALQQDYDGNVRVLILNDCPKQWLRCYDSRVQIQNFFPTYRTLGDKLNDLLKMATAPWIAFLDDDDIIMPWHLRRALDAIAKGKRTAAASHKFFFVGDKGDIAEPSLMDLLMERDLALSCGGFASLDNKQEHAFYDNFTKIEPLYRADTRARPSYLYIWGNGAHHVSGTGALDAGIGFRRDAAERMVTGKEPTGQIVIEPQWRKDYLAMVKEVLERKC